MSPTRLLSLTALLIGFLVAPAHAWAPSDSPHSIYTGEHYATRTNSEPQARTARKRHRHTAHARRRHHARVAVPVHRVPAQSGTIRSRTGATAHVNPSYATSFQCLVNKLDASGYKIEFMGGYGHRPGNPRSLHPRGLALDIDQVSRNYLKSGKRYPSNVNEMASACGLLHGDAKHWPRYPDYGHFQIKDSGYASDDDIAPQTLLADLDPGEHMCWGAMRPRFARTGPFTVVRHDIETPPKAVIASGDADFDYLCRVYNRQPDKVDQTGDFTWKDREAAKKRGMGVCEYVIGGMAKPFKRALASAGRAMDGDGLTWTILSGFRDDWRQMVAAGFKAATGNSLHGGSRATCGYSCGVAADIVRIDGAVEPIAHWMDKFRHRFGLARPMPGIDPAHVQLGDYGVAAGRTDRHVRVAAHTRHRPPSHHRRHYASR